MGLDEEATVVIGEEYDERVWEALRGVLRDLGASIVYEDWRLGGSQEIDRFAVELPAGRLCVESETYIGISISGSIILVESVRKMVAQRVSDLETA